MMQNNMQSMNQNQAACPPAQALSDQERALDLLCHEKATLSTLTTMVAEAANPALRRVLNDAYLQVGQDQYALFQQMQQKGWYEVKPAQDQDIQAACQKFQQMKCQLS